MKKYFYTATSVVALLILIVIYYFNSQYYVKRQINQANYCVQTSDCVDAGGKCPFDCYVFVNKKEATRIGKLIASYESTCVYGCIAKPEVQCRQNKCKVDY